MVDDLRNFGSSIAGLNSDDTATIIESPDGSTQIEVTDSQIEFFAALVANDVTADTVTLSQAPSADNHAVRKITVDNLESDVSDLQSNKADNPHDNTQHSEAYQTATDVDSDIQDHTDNDVHVQNQPPTTHDNTKHSTNYISESDYTNTESTSIYSGTLQTISADTTTQVSFDSIRFDDGGWANLTNNEIVVPESGKYHISTQVPIDDVNTPVDMIVYLNVNGNEVREKSTFVGSSATNNDLFQNIQDVVSLSASDSVTASVLITSGNNGIQGFTDHNWLTVTRVN